MDVTSMIWNVIWHFRISAALCKGDKCLSQILMTDHAPKPQLKGSKLPNFPHFIWWDQWNEREDMVLSYTVKSLGLYRCQKHSMASMNHWVSIIPTWTKRKGCDAAGEDHTIHRPLDQQDHAASLTVHFTEQSVLPLLSNNTLLEKKIVHFNCCCMATWKHKAYCRPFWWTKTQPFSVNVSAHTRCAYQMHFLLFKNRPWHMLEIRTDNILL